ELLAGQQLRQALGVKIDEGAADVLQVAGAFQLVGQVLDALQFRGHAPGETELVLAQDHVGAILGLRNQRQVRRRRIRNRIVEDVAELPYRDRSLLAKRFDEITQQPRV